MLVSQQRHSGYSGKRARGQLLEMSSLSFSSCALRHSARDLHSSWLLSPLALSSSRDYSYAFTNYTGARLVDFWQAGLLICSWQLLARWHQIKNASNRATRAHKLVTVALLAEESSAQWASSIGNCNLHNAITPYTTAHPEPLSHKSLIKSP